MRPVEHMVGSWEISQVIPATLSVMCTSLVIKLTRTSPFFHTASGEKVDRTWEQD